LEEYHHLLGAEFFTANNIPLKVLRRNPQPPYPLHSHDFMEMVVVISGRGIHYDSMGELSLDRGSVFVIKGDMQHGYRDLKNLCLINILFDIRHLAIPLADLGKSPGFHSIFTVDPTTRFGDIKRLMFRLDDGKLDLLLGKISGLEEILNGEEPGSQFLSIARFMEIMHFISREFDNQHEAQATPFPYRLGKLFSFMETNLAANPTIDELMEIAGMSESTLFRTFNRITGLSPLQYLRKLKIERACWYLRNSPFTMMEISQLLGYNDSNYFARQFRKVIGVSPSDYRKWEKFT